MRNAKGQFIAGIPPDNRMPIGSIRIRTRHKRYGEQRAWIKVQEPDGWLLLARYTWEQAHGAIPRGMGIHHKDENSLNDTIENLELLSKHDHLAVHRDAFREKMTAGFTKTRRLKRWTTISATKHTGRPPTWTAETLNAAMAAYRAGEGTKTAIEKRFNLSLGVLHRQQSKM